MVLIMLQGVLVLFFPAFPLVLPDFIFNFEQEPEELEKEIQLEENLNSNRRGDDADNQRRIIIKGRRTARSILLSAR